MDIETRVAGIPCVVRVTYFAPADLGCMGGEADFWRPPSPPDMEYYVLDRSGRPAEWLEKKLNARERARLEDEIAEALS
jgi:hypothetical protein